MKIRTIPLLALLVLMARIPFAQGAEAGLLAEDKAALDELRRAVVEQMEVDKEFALERALKRLDLSSSGKNVTTFAALENSDPSESSTPDESESPGCKWPNDRPSGVTKDEWAAIRKSNILAKGEFQCATYTLMDMDGDGKRDLLIEVLEGGTGIWSSYSVRRRVDNRFGRISNSTNNQAQNAQPGAEETALRYSTSGRGGNQHGYWVRLQNRTFLAYLDSHYGVDSVYLLRPFGKTAEVPVLDAHYRYSFSIPEEQRAKSGDEENKVLIDPELIRTLERAVKQSAGEYAKDSGVVETPCPSPESASYEEKSEYGYFGPGHYSFEIVTAFSFWWKQQCHIAELVNWFGAYRADGGLTATLTTRKPPEGEETNYDVHARRELTGLKTRQGKFEFN